MARIRFFILTTKLGSRGLCFGLRYVLGVTAYNVPIWHVHESLETICVWFHKIIVALFFHSDTQRNMMQGHISQVHETGTKSQRVPTQENIAGAYCCDTSPPVY